MIKETKRPIKSFTDLQAWKEGHVLVLAVYQATKSFPEDERFGLTSQLRRAVVSITSNIAEGFSRSGTQDKKHFYTIALASTSEVQNQLLIARDLGFITHSTFDILAEQTISTHKLLNGLIRSAPARPLHT